MENLKVKFQNVACTSWPIFNSFGPIFVYAGRAHTSSRLESQVGPRFAPPCVRIDYGGVSMQQMVIPYKLLILYKLVHKLMFIRCGITFYVFSHIATFFQCGMAYLESSYIPTFPFLTNVRLISHTQVKIYLSINIFSTILHMNGN